MKTINKKMSKSHCNYQSPDVSRTISNPSCHCNGTQLTQTCINSCSQTQCCPINSVAYCLPNNKGLCIFKDGSVKKSSSVFC